MNTKIINKAVSLLQERAYQEVLQLLAPLVNTNFPPTEATQLLALAYSKTGHAEAATQLYKNYLRLFSNNFHVWSNFGNHVKETDLEAAIDCYRKALALNPNYLNAIYGLSLALFKKNAFTEALTVTSSALQISNDSKFDKLMGHIYLQLNNSELAVKAFATALKKTPGDSTTTLNLSIALRRMGDFQGALATIKTFLCTYTDHSETLLLEEAALYLETGKIELAIAALKNITQRYPLCLSAHEQLDTTLYEIGEQASVGQSLQSAWANTGDPKLLVELAARKLKLGQENEAQTIIEQLSINELHSEKFTCLKACLLQQKGAYSEALSCCQTGRGKFGFSRELNLTYSRLLIQQSDFAFAEELLTEIIKHEPNNQDALGYLSTVWKLSKNAKYEWLCNFDEMVNEYSIFSEYYRTEDFNELIDYLRKLHHFQKEPLSQSLRGGTQTFGALFSRPDPRISKLRKRLEELVFAYVAEAQTRTNFKTHPFYRRLPQPCNQTSFQIVGSWSVLLKPNGFHVNHTHRDGWLSAALYLTLPSINNFNHPQGCLQFGKSNLELSDDIDPATRIVTPEIGKLVVFPSYFWHGTIPFFAGSERLTVAFDVRP